MSSDFSQPATPTIDIGGMRLPRHELAQVLPDIERFERHLNDALAVDADLKQGDGSIPDYVRQWPRTRIEAVVQTLKEIGSLREQTTDQMRDHMPNSN